MSEAKTPVKILVLTDQTVQVQVGPWRETVRNKNYVRMEEDVRRMAAILRSRVSDRQTLRDRMARLERKLNAD